MKFLKQVIASALGFLLALVLLSVIAMVVLAAVLTFSFSSAKTTVKQHSVLCLTLENPVPERTTYSFLSEFSRLGLPFGQTGLNDILDVICDAAENPAVDGICLQPALLMSANLAALSEIRTALLEFRKSGKFVVSYADAYSQKDYYLASAAGEVYLHPAGTLLLTGVRSEMLFFKDALEKLGVEMQVIRHGTFKSAVEPFLDNHMSEDNRMQTERYVNAVWNRMLEEICAGRSLSVERVTERMSALRLSLPEEVLAEGLVDSLFYDDQLESRLCALTGVDDPYDIHYLTVEQYLSAMDDASYGQWNSGNTRDCIALVYAEGDIVGDVPSSDGIITPSMMRDAFTAAREDSTVKAVVFRINSGGGSALASDVIWREVALTAAVKPVVASFGALAASGAYYMAVPATRIVASPYTLTGSIGVFGVIPSFQGLLHDKLGITREVVNALPHADRETVMRPLDAEEREAMQREVESTYRLFVQHVADGRHMTADAVEQLAEGRVWSASDAVANGLVDAIGQIDDAIGLAASLAGLDDDYDIWELPETTDWLTELMSGFSARFSGLKSKEPLNDLYEQVARPLERWQRQQGISAMLPFEIKIY